MFIYTSTKSDVLTNCFITNHEELDGYNMISLFELFKLSPWTDVSTSKDRKTGDQLKNQGRFVQNKGDFNKSHC